MDIQIFYNTNKFNGKFQVVFCLKCSNVADQGAQNMHLDFYLHCSQRQPFSIVVKGVVTVHTINSSPKNKFSDWSILKAFADNKMNETEILKYVLQRVENIVGKGVNAGYQHFLLFQLSFQKASCTGSL